MKCARNFFLTRLPLAFTLLPWIAMWKSCHKYQNDGPYKQAMPVSSIKKKHDTRWMLDERANRLTLQDRAWIKLFHDVGPEPVIGANIGKTLLKHSMLIWAACTICSGYLYFAERKILGSLGLIRMELLCCAHFDTLPYDSFVTLDPVQ